MLGEELQSAFLRQVVISLAEAAAFVAAEAMAGTLIDICLYFRLCSANRVHVTHWNGSVRLAEVHLHRATRPFILCAGNTAAIPTARCCELGGPRCTPPRNGSAEAVADDAELPSRQVGGGSLDVEHDLLVIELHAIPATL